MMADGLTSSRNCGDYLRKVGRGVRIRTRYYQDVSAVSANRLDDVAHPIIRTGGIYISVFSLQFGDDRAGVRGNENNIAWRTSIFRP